MLIRINFSILISMFFLPLTAQVTLDDMRKDISYYSDIVANAALSSTKEIANKELLAVVGEFLATEGSYDISLQGDIWLSVIEPPDSSWRMITWESEGKGGIEYHGYIQHSNGEVNILHDFSSEMGDISYDVLDEDYWFGSIYYNILEEVDKSGKPYYIIFGFNKLNNFTNRKVADVLTFQEGKPVFGKPVFKRVDEDGRDDEINRIYLEYSSDSNVTLNYNQGMGMIVYDHLINRMGSLKGQGPTMLPDGSYCGYKFEEGRWVYVDKLFDQISDTVPRPKPILGKSNKRDLFGKKKN